MDYGMSEDLGPVTYGSDQEEVFLGRDFGHTRNFSEDIASKIDVEVKRIVKECYDRAEQILKDNIDRLHRVANALLEKEKLEAEEFEALFANEEINLDLDIDTADIDTTDKEEDNKQ